MERLSQLSETATEELVEYFTTTANWSTRAVRIGIRAKFRCEYCDKDLLGSPESFKSWQEDHIIPKHAGIDPDDEDNIALSCRECNVDFKGTWDPRQACRKSDPSRQDLISAVRNHVSRERTRIAEQVARYRQKIEVVQNDA
jgi:hypothetical protein